MNNPNKCIPAYSSTELVFEYNDWTGEDEWVDKTVWRGGCEYEDISLHSYKCKICGDIGYYSGAGKLVETEGLNLNDAINKFAKQCDSKNKKRKPVV